MFLAVGRIPAAFEVSCIGPFDTPKETQEWIESLGKKINPRMSWQIRQLISVATMRESFVCNFCGKVKTECSKKNDCSLS